MVSSVFECIKQENGATGVFRVWLNPNETQTPTDAKVVGIEHANAGSATLYDPAFGSGSLLIRAAEAALVDVAIYGQDEAVAYTKGIRLC